MNRTALFAKKTPGGVLAIEDMARGTGDRWFVDSGATYASDATGYGTSPDKPFATLDYAIGQASANNGDIIYVMPGHAESYGSGEGFTADVAGLTVVCLGEGADRPTFTFAATDATCTVTAASFKMTGFLFLVSIDAVVTYVTVTGADCELAGEIRDTTDKEVVDGFTVSGDRFKARIVHRGYTSGDANDSTIALDGVDGADIYVEAYGKAGVGVVDMRSHACANVVVDGIFLVTSTTDFSKTVVDTVTGSTYKATGFDVAAGKRFSGNGITAKHSIDDFTVSTLGAGAITAAVIATGAVDADAIADNAIDAGALAADCITAAKIADDAITSDQLADDAITAAKLGADAITNAKIADDSLASEQFAASAAEKTNDGTVITRATAALPQTTAAAIFTITGLCLVKRIIGYVTTVVGNVPNATKLKNNPSGTGATTDLCATLDIDNAAVGSYFQVTGTFANAMVKTVDIPIPKVQAAEFVVVPGTIELDCAGSDGGDGRVKWSVTYVPLEAGANIAAA
jgi:hypothetical protein